ncbi:MAG: helix-turn-helix domain-containing protein [Acidianus sp.]|jgi:predicted transcriptional regulator|nr:helix-turn-helix domain-containing protein [Acidianus sp.]
METQIDIRHNIKCCYKLSESDVDVFLKILEVRRPITSQELSKMLKVSKTTVDGSLKRLIDIGLVIRKKSENGKIGRPTYIYYLPLGIEEKIESDLKRCADQMLNTKI